MFTVFKWETDNSIAQKQQANRNIKQMQTQKRVQTDIISKTGVEFPFKVFTKHFTKNYYFQELGWLHFPGSSTDYWTHGFPVKALHENGNVTA